MNYDNLTTEELLLIANETTPTGGDNTPLCIADYQNGRVVQLISSLMNEKDISQEQLAQKMGKSKRYVSRVLNETQQLNITSLALFTHALDCDFSIDLVKREI